jgi:hypothetical protein
MFNTTCKPKAAPRIKQLKNLAWVKYNQKRHAHATISGNAINEIVEFTHFVSEENNFTNRTKMLIANPVPEA